MRPSKCAISPRRSSGSSNCSPRRCSTTACCARWPKKSGDRFAATSGGGVFEGEILGIAAAGGAAAGAESLDGALPGQGAGRRGRAREGDPPAGASPSALRVAADSRLADGDGLESEPQAGASADGGTGVSAADSPENQGERAFPGSSKNACTSRP